MLHKDTIDKLVDYVMGHSVFGTTTAICGLGKEKIMVCRLEHSITVHINPIVTHIYRSKIFKKIQCLGVTALDRNNKVYVRYFYGRDIKKVIFGLNSLHIPIE